MENKEIVLEFRGVSVNNHRFKLENINFKLEKGYIYAIAGENGTGKTTLLRSIISDKKLKSGSILFYGEDIKNNRVSSLQKIGYISEDNYFFEDRTPAQIVEMLKNFYEQFQEKLFKDLMEEFNVSLSTSYSKLSRGEKMKFQLAFAYAHNSKLFIIDEATAGMDPVFRCEFFDLLNNLLLNGCTVLMTSHNMSEIEKRTDYMAFMEGGTLGKFEESMEVNINA